MNWSNLTLAANEIFLLVHKVNDHHNNTVWKGREYMALELLAEIMNFEIKVKPSRTVSAIINGTATGVLGMVAYGEADVGAGALTTSLDREKYIDYSPAIKELSYVIISDKPDMGVGYFSFSKPFRSVVWGLLIASLPISAFLLFIIHKSSKYFQITDTKKSYLWEVTKILLWDTTKMGSGPHVPLPIKVYMGIYMLAITIIVNIYLSELTSFITVEPYKWPPMESLEQLQNSHLKWLVRDSSTIRDLFKGNEIMTQKRISTNVTLLTESMFVALQLILDNPNTYVYIQPLIAIKTAIQMQYMDTEENHGFHFGKHPVSSSYNTFYLRKGAIYNNDLKLNIIKLTENGLIPQIFLREENKFLVQMRKFAKKRNRITKQLLKERVRMKHLLGSYVFITLGYSVSFAVLTWEIIWFKFGALMRKM